MNDNPFRVPELFKISPALNGRFIVCSVEAIEQLQWLDMTKDSCRWFGPIPDPNALEERA